MWNINIPKQLPENKSDNNEAKIENAVLHNSPELLLKLWSALYPEWIHKDNIKVEWKDNNLHIIFYPPWKDKIELKYWYLESKPQIQMWWLVKNYMYNTEQWISYYDQDTAIAEASKLWYDLLTSADYETIISMLPTSVDTTWLSLLCGLNSELDWLTGAYYPEIKEWGEIMSYFPTPGSISLRTSESSIEEKNTLNYKWENIKVKRPFTFSYNLPDDVESGAYWFPEHNPEYILPTIVKRKKIT